MGNYWRHSRKSGTIERPKVKSSHKWKRQKSGNTKVECPYCKKIINHGFMAVGFGILCEYCNNFFMVGIPKEGQ